MNILMLTTAWDKLETALGFNKTYLDMQNWLQYKLKETQSSSQELYMES